MRIADPRIRPLARIILDARALSVPLHIVAPDHQSNMPSIRAMMFGRSADRTHAIDAAVRVLRHLDGDVIDQWTDTVPSCGGEIRGWISPPHGTDMRVHVTVSHAGPAPGPIANLTDDEADRFADAIQEGR